ncbi:hypothetical protein J595_04058 [Acinetobacter sp. 1592897]|uniref:hypothetical protein n=1 Tax=Acinetobacter sp. 1592897 TaxID=1310696 RepID=UPI0004452B19|nr:hypothetical protein [Acinetobacter sp. 1592897]EYT12708.1 hypothetical protein J595_04058 [Acinetobacter sp. 1592897]
MSSGGNNSYNQVFDKNIQSMDQADAMKTKVLEMPDLNMLDLSYDQIKALTDEELVKLLSGESHEGFIREPTIQLISNELLMRQIKESSKHHWTTVPAFILFDSYTDINNFNILKAYF